DVNISARHLVRVLFPPKSWGIPYFWDQLMESGRVIEMSWQSEVVPCNRYRLHRLMSRL
ncbi:hypothetical protein NPIL_641881, partial [Nephila pilipes]